MQVITGYSDLYQVIAMHRTRTSHKYQLLAASVATIFIIFSAALAKNQSRSLMLSVTDESEQAVVGASVEIRPPGSTAAPLQGKTSEDGVCSFASLPGGSIEVMIKAGRAQIWRLVSHLKFNGSLS
jgi:hypothetical protein